jgi:hemerythrin-like domain-containing protein
VRPSEVRHRVLDDHEILRRMLTDIEALARDTLAGDRQLLGQLREHGEALLARLAEHMRWEDRYLSHALQEADAWGRERAAALEHEHQEQRRLLRDAVERLRDEARPAPMIARELADLVERLRSDMVEEERDLLDERVLRDDVVGIDVETG